MALFLHIHYQRRFIKEKRIFRDRQKSLDAYDDKEIVSKYGLSRQLITQLYDDIGEELEQLSRVLVHRRIGKP